jgi:hypothetical protein
MTELENVVLSSGGLLLIVTSPPKILEERRALRVASGSTDDHPLNPETELAEFKAQAKGRKWKVVGGNFDTEITVKSIIDEIVRKNPECRMERKMEDEPIEDSMVTRV